MGIYLSDLSPKMQAVANEKLRAEEKKRRSKYNNQKTERDGYKFDSLREAARYDELVLLERAGVISGVQMQVEYTLTEGYRDFRTKKRVKPMVYRADFVYRKDGRLVVEDVKGYRTQEYINKKKIMLSKYGIEVIET